MPEGQCAYLYFASLVPNVHEAQSQTRTRLLFVFPVASKHKSIKRLWHAPAPRTILTHGRKMDKNLQDDAFNKLTHPSYLSSRTPLTRQQIQRRKACACLSLFLILSSFCSWSIVPVSLLSSRRCHPLRGRAGLRCSQRSRYSPPSSPPCVCMRVCARQAGRAEPMQCVCADLSLPKHPPILPGYCGGSGRGRQRIGRFSHHSSARTGLPVPPLHLHLLLSIISLSSSAPAFLC